MVHPPIASFPFSFGRWCVRQSHLRGLLSPKEYRVGGASSMRKNG
nr:MAG TPA: hypothetical protein [Bacteriophage sp.]